MLYLCIFLYALFGAFQPCIGEEGTVQAVAIPNSVNQKKHDATLYASIEHSAELKPVEAGLRAGASFDQTKLKALTPNNQWFKIPSWYAGTWETRNQTTYYKKSLKTGAESFSVGSQLALGGEMAGFQKDAEGNIWEYQYSEYNTVTQLKSGFQYDHIQTREPLKISPNEVVMKYVSSASLINVSDRRILNTDQVEAIQTYVPEGPNLIKVDASIKAFDEMGQPLQLAKTTSISLRKGPFVPIDKYGKLNMVQLLDEYLESHGLEKLRVKNTRKRP